MSANDPQKPSDRLKSPQPRQQDPLTIQRPGQAQLLAAVEQLLGSDRRRAERFMRFARDVRMSLEHVWCGVNADQEIKATVLASPSPGRTALLFVSTPKRMADVPLIAPVVDAACQGLRAADVGLAQALVDPVDQLEADVFEQGGLHTLATLTYMERPVPNKRSSFQVLLPQGITIEPYQQSQRAELEALLVETYQDTLDCPDLVGLRRPDDVVDGHMSAGVFKPEWWSIVRKDGCPVGVSLLNGSAGSGSIELVYLGLIPEVRGQGIGHGLLNHNLQLIAGSREQKIVLAVDEANTPALKMYEKIGFIRTVRRQALVRPLDLEHSDEPDT